MLSPPCWFPTGCLHRSQEGGVSRLSCPNPTSRHPQHSLSTLVPNTSPTHTRHISNTIPTHFSNNAPSHFQHISNHSTHSLPSPSTHPFTGLPPCSQQTPSRCPTQGALTPYTQIMCERCCSCSGRRIASLCVRRDGDGDERDHGHFRVTNPARLQRTPNTHYQHIPDTFPTHLRHTFDTFPADLHHLPSSSFLGLLWSPVHVQPVCNTVPVPSHDSSDTFPTHFRHTSTPYLTDSHHTPAIYFGEHHRPLVWKCVGLFWGRAGPSLVALKPTRLVLEHPGAVNKFPA